MINEVHMNETKILLSLSKSENELLRKISQSNETSMTEYIKYRVFRNNPELTDKEFIFHRPSKDKHEYLTIGMIQELYLLIMQILSESKTDEAMEKIKQHCREQARMNIANYGYIRVKSDE